MEKMIDRRHFQISSCDGNCQKMLEVYDPSEVSRSAPQISIALAIKKMIQLRMSKTEQEANITNE